MLSLATILICSFLTTVSTHETVDCIDEKNEKFIHSFDQHMINCSLVDKYVLFAALYNHACPRGKGTMNGVREEFMDRIKAKQWLDRYTKYYFLRGMYFEIDFGDWPHVNAFGYDARYGGPGTFKSLCNELKERNDDSVEITMFSKVNVSLRNISDLKEFTKVKFSQEVVELIKAHDKSNSDGWFLFEGINKYGEYQFISTAWEWIKFDLSLLM